MAPNFDDDDDESDSQVVSTDAGQSSTADDESSSWSGYTPTEFPNARPRKTNGGGSSGGDDDNDDLSSTDAPPSLIVEEREDELGYLESSLIDNLGPLIIEDNQQQPPPSPAQDSIVKLDNFVGGGGGDGGGDGGTDGGGKAPPTLSVLVDRSRGNSMDGELTVTASHVQQEDNDADVDVGGWEGYLTGETATERLSRASSARGSPVASSRLLSGRSASDIMRSASSRLGAVINLAKEKKKEEDEDWDPSGATAEDDPRKRMHEMTYDQITAYTKNWSKKRLTDDLTTLHSLLVSTTQRGAQDCKIVGRRLRMTPSLSSSLGRRHVNMLAKRFILYFYRDKERIFEQGDVGDMFYIVFDGSVDIIVDGHPVARLSNTESFGDTALRTQQPRSGAAVAVGDVILMGLTAFNFAMILQKFNRERDEKCATFLQTHCIFLRSWPEYRIKTLIHQSHHQEYKRGTRIWYQDDDAETVAVLLDGDVVLEREVGRRLSNRWPVRLNSPSRARRRGASPGGLNSEGGALSGGGGSAFGAPPLLFSGSDPDGPWQAPSPNLVKSAESVMSPTSPLALPLDPEKALLASRATNDPNTPRGIHHEEAREFVERHRQRVVMPGELIGEEFLCGASKRPCTALVRSYRATILVLNAKEALKFFKNDIESIAAFTAKFVASDEDIHARQKAHQIKESLRQVSCGDKYLKRKNAQAPANLPLINGKERRPWTTSTAGRRRGRP